MELDTLLNEYGQDALLDQRTSTGRTFAEFAANPEQGNGFVPMVWYRVLSMPQSASKFDAIMADEQKRQVFLKLWEDRPMPETMRQKSDAIGKLQFWAASCCPNGDKPGGIWYETIHKSRQILDTNEADEEKPLG